MRFNLRTLLLYVMPCIAIAGTAWTMSDVFIPERGRWDSREGYLLARIGMCIVIPGWWILVGFLASNVYAATRTKDDD